MLSGVTRPIAVCAVLFLLGPLLTGCGYSFQNTYNPLLEHFGVRKVYVAPVVNETLKPGVENLIFNELLRIIATNKRVILVSRPEEADAVLTGGVIQAAYNFSSQLEGLSPVQVRDTIPQGTFGDRNPGPLPPTTIYVTREYTAALDCTFYLNARNPKPGEDPLIWSSQFHQEQPFPANNQFGIAGNTSALINDSEFERVLRDLARIMMADVHESMLAMF